MAALPLNITLNCPICDAPVPLPVRAGPVKNGALTLSLGGDPLRKHVEAEHPDACAPRRRTPRPGATAMGVSVNVRPAQVDQTVDQAVQQVARQMAREAASRPIGRG
ncbi:hypothetical protein ACIRH0_04075 [Streptomyces sp. NPDC093675]|uniref:hypothetical protein n=1 Tax=Streptomyces sp. NPDC093675 TaxID=3366049 RepID=UPI00380556AD